MKQVIETINTEWKRLYGGESTCDPNILAMRVKKIAEDRDSWLANAKANQKENNRLERKLNGSEQ